MALSRRYHPEWPPGESSQIGIDMSGVLPPGTRLEAASLELFVNRNPVEPTTDWALDDPTWSGRQAWCRITGGASGVDYQCQWILTDSRNNVWVRTTLLLCAQTS